MRQKKAPLGPFWRNGVVQRRPSTDNGSETEGQKLGVTGGIAVDQGAKANLVGDAGSGKAFGDDAEDDANHGGAAIKEFSPFELLHMDFGLGARELPVVGGGVGHEKGGWGGFRLWRLGSAGFRGQIGGAGQHKGHHPGQDQNEGGDASDGGGVVSGHGDQPVEVSKCYRDCNGL